MISVVPTGLDALTPRLPGAEAPSTYRPSIKFSGLHVRLELPIPSFGVKGSKPLTKRGKLLGRK
jgi:hypothetical protein